MVTAEKLALKVTTQRAFVRACQVCHGAARACQKARCMSRGSVDRDAAGAPGSQQCVSSIPSRGAADPARLHTQITGG